ISLRQKQKKLIMLPSETMIWQPEFTDKTLSRKTGAVQKEYKYFLVTISVNQTVKPCSLSPGFYGALDKGRRHGP
ncbi:hypothetical protein ACIPS2_004913, partial [Escherichia coli]